MDISLLGKGVVIGFSIAAPVGPIGALCIRTTLMEGRLKGLAAGLGAAVADAVYGCIAGLGLTLLAESLVKAQSAFQIGGGLVLGALGAKTLLADVGEEVPESATSSIAKTFATTFVLTLANPATIIAFTALLASAGLGAASQPPASALTFISGVFWGSASWWLLLTGCVAKFRHKVSDRGRRGINWMSGGMLIAFGALSIAHALFKK